MQKPDALPELENTMIVSARKGWLTVDDKGLNRKNAPQVRQIP